MTSLSWNIRDVSCRINDLLYYVYNNNDDIICLQEPFTSSTKLETAPRITGYHSYTNTGMTGLLTYVGDAIPHKLVKTSDDNNVQYHHLHIRTASGFSFLYNAYAKCKKFQTYSLPNFQNHGTICKGDLNAGHSSFGDSQCNESGEEFRHFVNIRSMTVYDTNKKTHVAGGRLDYVIGRDIVHGNVNQ